MQTGAQLITLGWSPCCFRSRSTRSRLTTWRFIAGTVQLPTTRKTFIFHATILHLEHVEGLTPSNGGTSMHIYIRKTPTHHLLSSVATQGCSHTPQALILYLHLRRMPRRIRVFGRPSSRRLRLHSPVDRGGNGNTPCIRPVKRQFPRDTPLLRTAHCYAFLIRDTHTHTHTHTHSQASSNLSNVFIKLPLSQALNPNCCRSGSL